MGNFLVVVIAVGGAYLIGSIPFGYLIARFAAGVDIRLQGSGNIGATNVGRMIGTKWGVLVLLLDCAKGLLPVVCVRFGDWDAANIHLTHVQVACGLAAIGGHMFPCWLRFRGGKGVATGLGVVLVLSPWATLAAVIAFAGVFLACRIVSLGSIVASVTFAVTQFVILWPRPFSSEQWSLAVLSLLLPALIIVRHRSNIRRLIHGEEPRLTGRRRTEAEETTQDESGAS